MRTLTVTRGLPGSGKSTWARQAVTGALAAGRRTARVNRDDTRTMFFGSPLPGVDEDAVTVATHAAILALLRAGVDVVCDDTNLPTDRVAGLERLARHTRARFVVEDRFLAVPVQTCVDRDRARVGPVGEDVIRAMAAQHGLA